MAAASRVGVRVATCYGAAEHDSEAERRLAWEECRGLSVELARQRSGRQRAMFGVQAHSLDGVERLLREALEVADERLAVHVDLALDLTPAERWRARAPRPEGAPATLWAHAETAPRGLLGDARERGDALCAVGAGSVAALMREAEVGWGSDAGVNAPPVPDAGAAWATRAGANAHYQRLFVHGARWAAEHFGEGLGEIRPGAPADLILVDYFPATELTTRTLVEHLWSGLLRAPVAGAMVAGEVIMDGGQIVAVDEREVAARARECAARVWERLG
jgi:cytosine/adenosine deaminase-related metal-dependent hydrolase